MDNVVPFKGVTHTPQSLNEIAAAETEKRVEDVNEFAYALACGVVITACDAGYRIAEKPQTAYDAVLIIEAIKSLLLRSIDIKYPLQDDAGEMIEIDDPAGFIGAMIEPQIVDEDDFTG